MKVNRLIPEYIVRGMHLKKKSKLWIFLPTGPRFISFGRPIGPSGRGQAMAMLSYAAILKLRGRFFEETCGAKGEGKKRSYWARGSWGPAGPIGSKRGS